MKKKKHSFTLIEVMIAIFLATGACFFLLDFEESYIKNTRESLKKVQKERLIQEAYVVLLEQLYTNQIPWKLIEDKKSYTYPLSDADWEVEAQFNRVVHKDESEQISSSLMDIKVNLVVRYMGKEESEQPEIRLCLKKEGSKLVETPT